MAGRVLIGFYVWDQVVRHSPEWLYNDLYTGDTPSSYFDLTWPVNENGQGFIVLEYREDSAELEVVRVRRPRDDPEELEERKTFCSSILPIAIVNFLKGLNAFDTIQSILIFNDSDNRVASCKCYSRTLSLLGFTYIREQVWTREEIELACVRGNLLFIQAMRSSWDTIVLPSEEDYLDSAQVHVFVP